MTDRHDAIVADYLDRVSRAMAGVPAARRDELIRDLGEHIEVGRAELADESEAQIRALLERLGDPEAIAQAAAADAGTVAPVDPPPQSASRAKGVTIRRPAVVITVAVVVIVLALCAAAMFFAEAP